MNELLRIADFGYAGVNTDRAPTLLQQGEWTWLRNIDLESGDIRSAWGDTLIAQNPPVVPKHIFIYEGAEDTWLVVADGAGGIYAYDGVTWQDIAPYSTAPDDPPWDDSGTVGDGTWDGSGHNWDTAESGSADLLPFDGPVVFDVFLGTLIATAANGVPCYWPDTSGRLEILPGWDESWRTQGVYAYSNFLVAIGLDDGVIAGAKYRVAWSDAAVEGFIPQEWVATTTNLAGSVQLRDTDGYLVLAARLRNDLIIYKNDSIYRMFTRGDELVMGFEGVSESRGCDSLRGVAAMDGVHFFADRGDVLVFDGQTTKSVATQKIKNELSSAMSHLHRDATQIVAFPERSEIWVGVVPAGSTSISAVLLFSAEAGAWTARVFPGALAMTVGPFSSLPGGGTADIWDEVLGTWDEQEDTWNAGAFDPSEDAVVLSNPTQVWRGDKTHTDQDGNPKECFAERRGFQIQGARPNMTIRGVYPEMVFDGEPVVEIQLGAQRHVGGPVEWTPPQEFRPGFDKKISARITGQPCAFRITSKTDGGWRLAALSLKVTPASGR